MTDRLTEHRRTPSLCGHHRFVVGDRNRILLVNPPELLHVAHVRSGYIAIGLVSSAGAAFWNHILDIMRAAKVEKESAVQSTIGDPLGHISAATHG